jgi:PAS domain S-box-containing protein
MVKPPHNPELERYKRCVGRHLNSVSDLLARISVGDFSGRVPQPRKDDEFTDLYVGIQLLLDIFQENLQRTQEANRALTQTVMEARASGHAVKQEKVIDEAILDSIGEGLIVTNTAFDVTIINRRARQMLGVDAATVVGRKIFDVVSVVDADGQEVKDAFRVHSSSARKMRQISSTNLFLSTEKVGGLPVSITSTPILLGGIAIGQVAVFRDLREEQEIDRAKTEVISFTSHQLRTPLSVINWYSESLLNRTQGPINQSQREYLEAILFTARRMIELVNTFLGVSRVQLGKLVVEEKLVDLQKIVENVYEELKPQVTQRQLRFAADYNQNTPPILSDEKLLNVVLQNLIGNAVKYTPDKGVITVETNPITPADRLPVKEGALIVIRDSGYGIPKKQQARIFTKLFRAENAQKIDTEGTGLGLYMVKSLLNYVGGEVWFRSWPKKGTVFFVALPTRPILRKSRLDMKAKGGV